MAEIGIVKHGEIWAVKLAEDFTIDSLVLSTFSFQYH